MYEDVAGPVQRLRRTKVRAVALELDGAGGAAGAGRVDRGRRREGDGCPEFGWIDGGRHRRRRGGGGDDWPAGRRRLVGESLLRATSGLVLLKVASMSCDADGQGGRAGRHLAAAADRLRPAQRTAVGRELHRSGDATRARARDVCGEVDGLPERRRIDARVRGSSSRWPRSSSGSADRRGWGGPSRGRCVVIRWCRPTGSRSACPNCGSWG